MRKRLQLDDSEQPTTLLSWRVEYDAACRDALSDAQQETVRFHSGIFIHFSPPKEVPHLLSQVFGVENLGETNLLEFYAADQQGSCGCAAEETNCLGSLAVLTLLWKMFYFPEQ